MTNLVKLQTYYEFSYLDDVRLDNISQSVGPQAGGTILTLQGSGFHIEDQPIIYLGEGYTPLCENITGYV